MNFSNTRLSIAATLLALSLPVAAEPTSETPASTPSVRAADTSSEQQKLTAMMEEARQAFARGDLDRSVALYTRLTEMSEHPRRARALEFLGVTRQKKGQLAHAKAVFERYLLEYPDSEGRIRIQQRLAAITAAPTSRQRGNTLAKKQEDNAWDLYGSQSSHVRRSTVSIDDADYVTNLAMWQSNLDLVARRRGESVDILSRLSTGYRHDFSDARRDYGGVIISNAYLDITARNLALQSRLGRQSRNSGGVYGRFDGGLFSWDWRDIAALNFVAGYPVQRSSSALASSRVMYGVSADISTAADALNLSLFANNHTVDGIPDRRGVGGEFRYVNARKNVFGLLDYDTLYSTVNATLLGASWTNSHQFNVHGSIDFRRSPLLSTSNAVIGQSGSSLDELSLLLTEAELQALAEDNTATSSTATLGFSAPLSRRLQLNMYAHANQLETAVSFASLAGANPNTNSVALNTQLVASGMLLDNDAWIVGVRMADSQTYRTTTVSLNTRIPVTANLRVNPLLKLSRREQQTGSNTEWIVAPGLRASLRWQRRFAIELEVRGDNSERTSLAGDTRRSSYYFSLGYRANFGR